MDELFALDDLLTEAQIAFKQKLDAFVDEKVLPDIAEHFENARFMRHLIPELAKFNLFGMTLSRSQFGMNASYVDYGLACAALERGDSALRSFLSVQGALCMTAFAALGDDDQQTYWLPKLQTGEAIGAFALSEVEAGSDPAHMQTSAEKTQDGWVLNGEKMWVTNGPFADVFIVFANTKKGLRAFWVASDTTGMTREKLVHKLSLRTSATGRITFKDCVIPENQLLPESEVGLKSALVCLNQARFGIAWGVMGAASECFKLALHYCKTRKQFGKPLAAKQLVQAQLVEMASEIAKAQTLNFRLAEMLDNGLAQPHHISTAKRNACHHALNIARTARSLLGAQGILLENHVMRHACNLESVLTYEGTEEIHTLILGQALTSIDAIH